MGDEIPDFSERPISLSEAMKGYSTTEIIEFLASSAFASSFD